MKKKRVRIRRSFPRRRFPTPSKSTAYSVEISYKGYDPAFDEALRAFAKYFGAGHGGSGCYLPAMVRDISFYFKTWEKAREFLVEVRTRFRVRSKILNGKHL